jgi:very-short-patch-repair endonuclease
VELPPEPDYYFEHVLTFAEPGAARLRMPGPVEQWQDWWTQRASEPGAVVAAAAAQGFVVTAEQVRALGVSRQQCRTRVARGLWTPAARGVVAPVDVRDDDPHVERRRRHAVAAAGSALSHAGHVVSARSAAVQYGLPTLHVPRTAELTGVEPDSLGRRPAKHVFGASVTAEDVTTWFGAPVTTVARTLVDLARHDRRDAIMAVDAAGRERLVSSGDLDAALAQAAGWPGVRQARQVLALADGRAESALESLTRLALIEDGFPVPELQVPIGPYRVDLLFDEARLILEADGLAKYTDAEWRREKRREADLRRMGYWVERVTWDDVVRFWPHTRIRLLEALRQRAARPASRSVWLIN